MGAVDEYCFRGGGLERAAHRRREAAALLTDPAARVLPIWQGKPLALAEDRLGWVTPDLAALDPGVHGAPVFLGLDGTAPRFALDLSAWVPEGPAAETLGSFVDPSEQAHPGLPGGRFVELRRVMTRLSPLDAELAAVARALTQWHATHGFCARCGTASLPAMGGWQRDCPACGASHYPRTDPVVIMLITHGNRVLLGRNPSWPERMYSLLAGFVEPGEAPEAAVRREVMEEAGIVVGRVRYLASQPWPFPTQLMVACAGEALSDAITVDPEELEEARWVSREELAQAFLGQHPEISPARPGAIARSVLSHWLADRLDRMALDGETR